MLRLNLQRAVSPPVIFLVLENSEQGETTLIPVGFSLLLIGIVGSPTGGERGPFALDDKTLDRPGRPQTKRQIKLTIHPNLNPVPWAVVLGSEWCPRNASRELSWDEA